MEKHSWIAKRKRWETIGIHEREKIGKARDTRGLWSTENVVRIGPTILGGGVSPVA